MGDEPSRGPMMTRVCWRLVDILSLMLRPDERQAVRGDLVESGATGSQAPRDICVVELGRTESRRNHGPSEFSGIRIFNQILTVPP